MGREIINYHPGLVADRNLLLTSQRPLDRRDYLAMAGAAAVLLPQVCRPDLYGLVSSLGLPHFPRPAVHLSLDGKVGNCWLFRHLDLPHPRTLIYDRLDQAVAAWRAGEVEAAGITPPLVAKGAGGGQGSNVFLVASPEELQGLAHRLETRCFLGPPGMVLQERIPLPGRDARVVLVGDQVDCFWRVAPDPKRFFTCLSQGGRVERGTWPEEMARAVDLAQTLQRKAGLDLAGVDVLVPEEGPALLLEINFFFGRNAHGGTAPLRAALLRAVRSWLARLGLDPERASLAED